MADFKLAQGERLYSERRTATFRKERFEYVHTCIIDEAGDSWTTTELDEANVNQVYNQYRIRHGIPFPDEINALRKYYDLSAAKMSEILGFGANQYRNYECGDMPGISNARILIAIRDKNTFLDFVDASKEILGEKDYARIHKKVSGLGDYKRPLALPSLLSGYVEYSPEKIAVAVKFFIRELGGVFVTKMNKLLFYIDFLCYRRRGYGITGLQYAALQYGPVPVNWGAVYSAIPDVEMNEVVFPDMTSGVKLESKSEPAMELFEEKEIKVISDVADRFRNTNAGEISSISHKEKCWIENHKERSCIDYSYAFELSII